MPRTIAKHHKKTARNAHIARKPKQPRATKPAHPKETTAPEQQMMRTAAFEEEPLTVFFERVETEPRTVQIVEVEDWPL